MSLQPLYEGMRFARTVPASRTYGEPADGYTAAAEAACELHPLAGYLMDRSSIAHVARALPEPGAVSRLAMVTLDCGNHDVHVRTLSDARRVRDALALCYWQAHGDPWTMVSAPPVMAHLVRMTALEGWRYAVSGPPILHWPQDFRAPPSDAAGLCGTRIEGGAVQAKADIPFGELVSQRCVVCRALIAPAA